MSAISNLLINTILIMNLCNLEIIHSINNDKYSEVYNFKILKKMVKKIALKNNGNIARDFNKYKLG